MSEKCNFVFDMLSVRNIRYLFAALLSVLFIIPIKAVQRHDYDGVASCEGVSVGEDDGGGLRFVETEYDFGTLREERGVVTHSFSFLNGGSVPVSIVSASTTCGCTVASYPRGPVMPSESSSIEVSFDPKERPGRFEKVVTVTTSEGGAAVRLRIRGNVIPRERTTEESYPFYIGDGLRLESNFHSFSYIMRGRDMRTSIGIVNTSDKAHNLRITGGGIYRTEYPSVLGAGERGKIYIVCNVACSSDIYGTVTESLHIDIDGRRSDAEITITGIVVDNSDDIDEISAPSAVLNKNIIKFGGVKRDGGMHRATFEIANAGETTLYVRAIEGVASGTTLSIGRGESIAAGQSREVTVTIDPSKMRYGPNTERIRFIFNDPLRPMREVKVTAVVSDF